MHWQHLDAWLYQHREFWQPQPFTEPRPAWMETHPELAAWLLSLDASEWATFEQQPETLLPALTLWLPDLASGLELTRVPLVSAQDASLAEREAKAMPGRKRLQAGAFTGALLPLDQPLFDWCCGSGHLARTLAAQTPHPVLGLERDPALVDKGNQLAHAGGFAVQIRQQDVLQLQGFWPQQPHGVALHACGDLHRHLLQQALEQQLPRLSVSPCCYHLTQHSHWQPLSKQAESSALRGLDTALLRLAVQETVTAADREARQRDQLKAWRLGFDGLQRQLRGEDTYLPLPSVSPRFLQGGFEDFCHWAAQKKGLECPPGIDFQHWEEFGQKRLHEVQRLELLRHLFRRPLEIWLVLDYVLALQEAGYQVRLEEFCSRSLTPRNLLIDAHLKCVQPNSYTKT